MNKILSKDRDYQGDKIDPNQPYQSFDSRVKNLSDYCDVIKKQLDEIRSLGGCSELEHYDVGFNELIKLFDFDGDSK